jgi:predicted transcriptional regulator
VKSFSDSVADRSREEIYIIFRRAGYTMTQFAEELGVYPSAVSQWFSGKSESARIYAAAQKKASELATTGGNK